MSNGDSPETSIEVSRLLNLVRAKLPEVIFATDEYMIGGCLVDFKLGEKLVVVEWRPTDVDRGWNADHYGISRITPDTTPFEMGQDEWVIGAKDAAKRVIELLKEPGT